MSKSSQITTGIIIIIAIVVGLFFWYRATLPTAAEVDLATKKIQPIQTNIISDPISKQILTLDTNGNVPVVVKPEDIGKSNPFQ